MEQIQLSVKKRGTGKQNAKKLRRQGLTPGVFYKHGSDAIPILSDPLALRSIVYTSDTKLINLQIEGDSEIRDCVLKDVVFDPVTDKIVHFDLAGFISDEIIHVDIPIVLKGQAVGAKEGGIIQHTLHKVKIKCLAKDIPNHFEVDITNLKLGKSIHLKDIKSENIEFEITPDTVIVSCVPPRVTGVSKVAEATTEGETTEQ